MQIAMKSIERLIWHFVKKQGRWFAATQFFALALALDATLWPYIIKVMIEKVETYTGPRDQIWSAISGVVLIALLLWILIDIAFWLNGLCKAKTSPKFEAEIRMFMYDYVNGHSYSFFVNNFAGSIANRIADMPRSCGAIVDMVITTFIPTLAAVLISVSLFWIISAPFALILASWVAMHIIICYYYSKDCARFSAQHSESRSKLIGRIVDTITNNFNVRLFARNKYEYKYTLEYQEDEAKKHAASLRYVENMRFALSVICFLITGVLLIWYEVHCYKLGIINIPEFVYILSTTFQITSMTWIAGIMLPDFFTELGIARQALNLVSTPMEVKDIPGAKELKVEKGEIVFENISFGYYKTNKLFQNKSLKILPGQKVGLVGYSGSGKTSLAHLLLRHYELDSGRILIDGQDIRGVTQASLRRQIAVIPQEPMLFHRSFLENIRYGNIEATNEEVMEAAKVANCHEFIMNSAAGYDTISGERGSKLSGGQRQRIAIARAILKNAPILIMDEATSAMDSITEKQIQESLDYIMRGRTVVIIAHKLSTLVNVDRIIVLKKGNIVGDGSHEELIEQKGEYYKLWSSQNEGLLPEGPIDE